MTFIRAGLAGALLLLQSGLALGVAAALAPAGAVAQGATVAEILVVGNRRIEAATVETYLTVARGDPISRDALNDSVRRLFATGLFRDASIAVDGRRLIVQVVENPTINRINFEGNDIIPDEQLLATVTSRPRRAFTRSRAEADAAVLTDLYRRTGRYAAVVEPVIIERDENRVDLVFEIQEGDVTGVKSISFVGNETYSDFRLRRVITTSESGLLGALIASDIYDPDRLEFDRELLRQFYLSRGYADFVVTSAVAELAPERDGFFITFTLDEGPVYEFGEQRVIARDPALDAEAFEALIEGDPGDTYDADVIEENIDRMIFRAGEEGFAFVEVRPRAIRDRETLTIDIEYELAEGRRSYVERIEIEGNTRTLDRVIRREFDLAEGDAFNSREIADARRRIRGLGYFSAVEVASEPGAADDQTIVRVSVEEQPTGSLSFGAGFSSSDGIIGEASITERNFLGRGQLVRLRGTASADTQTLDFAFREPAFLDRDLTVGFDAFYLLDDRSDESSFEETNYGVIPVMSFPVSDNGRLQLEYEISGNEIRDVSDDASEFIKADEGDALTSAVGYTYTFDQRNDPLQPTAGYIFRLSQDFAGLGGDTRYVRTRARARAFTAFFDEDLILSLELEGGHIEGFDEDVRITDRFFIGGDSFRGFRYGGVGPRDDDTDDSLGGNTFAVLRAEATFPIGLPEEFGIYGGVFTDIGTLYQLDRTELNGATVDDELRLRQTVGVSLFWDTGIGPLRINLARPIRDEDGDDSEFFRLTAGTRF